MASLDLMVLVCLIYVAFLFLVAFAADRIATHRTGAWLQSPWIYTLSLSIYCTAWTFYGAVGYAARSGMEFVTISLGPTLVMAGWWWGLRKLARSGRSQRDAWAARRPRTWTSCGCGCNCGACGCGRGSGCSSGCGSGSGSA